MHNSSNEPLNSVLRRSYDIEKAFKFIAAVVGNNKIPQTNQKSTIPTIMKNIGQIPRVVPYTTNQKMVLPLNEGIKPTSVGLVKKHFKITEKERKILPGNTVLTRNVNILRTF